MLQAWRPFSHHNNAGATETTGDTEERRVAVGQVYMQLLSMWEKTAMRNTSKTVEQLVPLNAALAATSVRKEAATLQTDR